MRNRTDCRVLGLILQRDDLRIYRQMFSHRKPKKYKRVPTHEEKMEHLTRWPPGEGSMKTNI